MKQFLLLLLCSIASLGVNAQSDVDTIRLSDYLSGIEKSGQCIGSLSIMKDGESIYARRLGKSLIAKEQALDSPLYRIGSISKMFTAVLIYQQVEKGKLKLDNKLSDYFPEVPRAEDITIYQLLEHSAGLGNYAMKNDSSYTWMFSEVSHNDIMKEIIRQGVLYEPGKGFKYSNTGYYLLANILVKIARKPYSEIVEESIIRPLKLNETHSGIIHAANIASPFEKNEAGEWVEVPDFYFPNVIGVGELASTPGDINRFLHALFSGKLISSEHLQQTMKPFGTDRHGRGMMYMPYHEHNFYGHTGDTFGVHSIGVYNEQDGISIAVNMNGGTIPFSDFLLGIFNSIYWE